MPWRWTGSRWYLPHVVAQKRSEPLHFQRRLNSGTNVRVVTPNSSLPFNVRIGPVLDPDCQLNNPSRFFVKVLTSLADMSVDITYNKRPLLNLSSRNTQSYCIIKKTHQSHPTEVDQKDTKVAADNPADRNSIDGFSKYVAKI